MAMCQLLADVRSFRRFGAAQSPSEDVSAIRPTGLSWNLSCDRWAAIHPKAIPTLREKTMAATSFYRLPAIIASTGLCSSSLYALMAQGLFPKNVKLGPRAVGWPAAEVDAWAADRIASRTEQTLTATEQGELSALLARFPEIGAEPDVSGMTVYELRGLLRFLQRKAQED